MFADKNKMEVRIFIKRIEKEKILEFTQTKNPFNDERVFLV
jgi:hypothetical protein